ncbi:glycosyltransferase [Faecalitalea cylindroides]|uniref:Glycosyltransferase n=1 Tax=Faecalitalea cylindroides TaxID=39483 RepID=A0AAW6FPE0_9FIRM|nr:glycosyltransferase [Faecalitalea cylindroides]MDC0827350.1 glycosyltransferase [Faecalitalea cylindroides]
MAIVSIIVPVYNVSKYLDDCINSLVNQTLKDIEIVLVDDGSTDSSKEICDKWERKDLRIKVIHKTNGGLSSARNEGLKLATSQWIAFCDSDDYIKDSMYEEMLSVADDQTDIVICGHSIVSNSLIIETVHSDGYVKKISGNEALYLILEDKEINSFAWDKLYRRDLFEGFIWENLTYHEDVASTFKLFQKAQNVVLYNKSLYFYRRNPKSICHTLSINKVYNSYKAFLCRDEIIRRHFPSLLMKNISLITSRAIIVCNAYARKLDDNEEYVECFKWVKRNTKSILKNTYIKRTDKIYALAIYINYYLFKIISVGYYKITTIKGDVS